MTPATPQCFPDWLPISTFRKPYYAAKKVRCILAWCPDEPPGGRKRVVWWDPMLKRWKDDADADVRPTLYMELPPDPIPGEPT